MDLVHRLVGGAGKTKPTPICPFFYHLYESQGLLTEDKEMDYRAAQELIRYRIIPDFEPKSEHESEGVKIIIAPTPTVQKPTVVPTNKVKQGKWLKQTYRAPEGSPPVWSKGEGSQPQPKRPHPEEHQLESQPEPLQWE